ncbi:PREDICTED: tyrosine aminotransferase [Ceratosolen solmsi marchali]|uniref:Tyrosine aminotransferase n=1 Tax=Ceratosolen solmsi marchali TaxID=326594 RepID=A0AAJ6VMF4_9HYME|nr:PREDICTED: tyrosine aminotransferase [Ceratosolen solmsi marchali]
MSKNPLESSFKEWNVQASLIAKRTNNPIRSIIENIVAKPNPKKPLIALSIGDPTTFGNLKPAKVMIEAMKESIESQLYNGYAPSTGFEEARRAVAEYSSNDNVTVDVKDVVLCSGCSCALDLCITALAREGQNILIPRPGFSIYQTLAEALGITVKFYKLSPELDWKIDLDDLETQIDASTAAIVINNPSNPCGSVFSRQHLLDILEIAFKYYVPIIADEIYEYMVFLGHTYHSLASLSTQVPILSCSGLTKRFLVPGWRMGWIIIHDRQNILDKEIRKALQCLSQRIIGSNTIVQGALSKILKETPQKFFDNIMQTLHAHARLTYNYISKIPGLTPIMPHGAMYMMVHIDLPSFPQFNTEIEFIERLLSEESVFCLPGQCFSYPSYIRLVITVPQQLLKEACIRIQGFCIKYHIQNNSTDSVNKRSERGALSGNAKEAIRKDHVVAENAFKKDAGKASSQKRTPKNKDVDIHSNTQELRGKG